MNKENRQSFPIFIYMQFVSMNAFFDTVFYCHSLYLKYDNEMYIFQVHEIALFICLQPKIV